MIPNDAPQHAADPMGDLFRQTVTVRARRRAQLAPVLAAASRRGWATRRANQAAEAARETAASSEQYGEAS